MRHDDQGDGAVPGEMGAHRAEEAPTQTAAISCADHNHARWHSPQAILRTPAEHGAANDNRSIVTLETRPGEFTFEQRLGGSLVEHLGPVRVEERGGWLPGVDQLDQVAVVGVFKRPTNRSAGRQRSVDTDSYVFAATFVRHQTPLTSAGPRSGLAEPAARSSPARRSCAWPCLPSSAS